jgi:hypothetical protein
MLRRLLLKTLSSVLSRELSNLWSPQLCGSPLLRFGLWSALARAIYARMLHADPQDLRELRVSNTNRAAIKGDIPLMGEQFATFHCKLDTNLRTPHAGGGTQGASSRPAAPLPPKTRPTAPMFNGARDGTKITTWFEQLGAYAPLLNLTPHTLVRHASLCLSGKAAEQWAIVKEFFRLAREGRLRF